jgi:phosphoribosylanthranilate isomerase
MSGRLRIKLCGMTRREDAVYAAMLGVDAVGVIFYSASPRYVTPDQATRVLGRIPPFVSKVGVFVNPAVALVAEVLRTVAIDYLQFHGDESPEFCQQFDRPYIKAIPAVSQLAIIEAAACYRQASALLLDTPSTQTRGGSGQRFDWREIPPSLSMPMILAGGLEAEATVLTEMPSHLYGVDVCSGIEHSPGVKDHDKMRRFVQLFSGSG